MLTVKEVRKTLNRLPDGIVLAIGSRVIDPEGSRTCVAGWALREAIAREVKRDADDVRKEDDPHYDRYSRRMTVELLVQRFGGTTDEWYSNVYTGIVHYPETVETALMDRIMAAVSRAEK